MLFWFGSYYSTYGHVEKLAQEIKKGAESVQGVEAKLWQVPETLSHDILEKMSAPSKSDVPIISPNQLTEADGFVFGFPTRFGMMAGQFKTFMDSTTDLWCTQELAGKPAGLFSSTGCQGAVKKLLRKFTFMHFTPNCSCYCKGKMILRNHAVFINIRSKLHSFLINKNGSVYVIIFPHCYC